MQYIVNYLRICSRMVDFCGMHISWHVWVRVSVACWVRIMWHTSLGMFGDENMKHSMGITVVVEYNVYERCQLSTVTLPLPLMSFSFFVSSSCAEWAGDGRTGECDGVSDTLSQIWCESRWSKWRQLHSILPDDWQLCPDSMVWPLTQVIRNMQPHITAMTLCSCL